MDTMARAGATTGPHTDLSHDVLRGAAAIAGFIYGDAAHRRRVYHLAATTRLPVFRLGSVLCARRSTLIAWIAAQEGRAL